MATRKSTPKARPARKNVPIDAKGARSQNRDVATSATKQPVPIKPTKTGKANAVARAEEARAAGLLPPHASPNPVDDVTTPSWAQAATA